MQILFSVAVIWVSAAILPWSSVTVPLMGAAALFTSAFFYQPGPPVKELPPLFPNQPIGRVNGADNCAINALVQCLRLDPRFAGQELLGQLSHDLREQYLQNIEAGQFDAREALDAFLDAGEVPLSDMRLISLDMTEGRSFNDALQLAIPRNAQGHAQGNAPLPPVAWIHIKRFNEQYEKITTPLEPLEEFPIEETHYRLKAFVVHHGNLNYGHYTAYIDAGEGDFYCCDDETVTWITPGQWRRAALQSYLLLYVQ